MMKIFVIETGKAPELRMIKGGLECLQTIVEGYIEAPFISRELSKRRIQIICNEEGMLKGMQPSVVLTANRNGRETIVGHLLGTVIIASAGDEDFEGLSNEQIKYIEFITIAGGAEFRDEHDNVVNITAMKIDV